MGPRRCPTARGKAGVVQVGNLSGGGLSATLAIWKVGEHDDPCGDRGDPGRPDVSHRWRAVDSRAARPPARWPGVWHRCRRAGCCSAGSADRHRLCMSPGRTSALFYYSGWPRRRAQGPGPSRWYASAHGLCARRVHRRLPGGRYNPGCLPPVGRADCALRDRNGGVAGTELTYVAGVAIYMLITGSGYAAFTAPCSSSAARTGGCAPVLGVLRLPVTCDPLRRAGDTVRGPVTGSRA